MAIILICAKVEKFHYPAGLHIYLNFNHVHGSIRFHIAFCRSFNQPADITNGKKRPDGAITRMFIGITGHGRHVIGPHRAFETHPEISLHGFKHICFPIVVEGLFELMLMSTHIAEMDKVDGISFSEIFNGRWDVFTLAFALLSFTSSG